MINPESADAPLGNATAGPETTMTVPEKPARRSRIVLVAVVVSSILVGAAAATGVLLVTGLPGQPMHHYAVNVYLEHDATADQKAAIEAALPAFKPSGPVTFETRQEAFQKFQEMTKDFPDLQRGTKMEDLPESFQSQTKGRVFDCAGYAKVRHMPGVDKVQVLQDRVNGYGATIICDAEYAKP